MMLRNKSVNFFIILNILQPEYKYGNLIDKINVRGVRRLNNGLAYYACINGLALP